MACACHLVVSRILNILRGIVPNDGNSFVILRYSGILATFSALFFTSIQTKHCQAAVVSSQVGVILVVISSGIIFCYRIFAIWHGVKIVYALIGFMYFIMVGCWVGDLSFTPSPNWAYWMVTA